MRATELGRRIKRLEARAAGVSEGAYARRLRALADALASAKGTASPAMTLHRGGARAGLFHLEALARAHRKTIDSRAFYALQQPFKTLEDGLGAVDFHDALLRRLGDAADPAARAFFLGRRVEACAHLEHRLRSDGWYADGKDAPAALAAIVETLESVKFPGAKRELRTMGGYYAAEATELHRRLADGEYDFTDLESGVHEVRRRARWLSILPAACDGLFVRLDEPRPRGALGFYATPEVLASPFNAFPARKEVPAWLRLDSAAFFALSWLIATIGAWKDRGQLREALMHAWRELGVDAAHATAHAQTVLAGDYVEPAAVTRAVRDAVKRVVKDRVLLALARGVAGED